MPVMPNVSRVLAETRSVYVISAPPTHQLTHPRRSSLAPHVGANLDVMHADTTRMRTNAQGLKPFVMTNLKTLAGVADVVKFIETRGMLQKKSAPAVS